jgi:tetratricopeptide (TPR) repeat protein
VDTAVQKNLLDLAHYHHALAQKSGSTTDRDAAVRWYREYLEGFNSAPEAAATRLLLADLLFDGKRFVEAAQEYELAAYTYPNATEAGRACYAALVSYDKAEPLLPAAERLFEELGIAPIPLIVAGGINSPERVREALSLGAAGVQVGTPFAVTVEGDAHPNFKRVLAEARPEDIVTFMSVAGLPARAVRTPWLARYLGMEALLQGRAKLRRCTLAFECLAQCGLRDGKPGMGQFCIDHHLAAALRGDVDHGLFFRGSEPVPFGSEIRPVRDLTEHLLGARVH